MSLETKAKRSLGEGPPMGWRGDESHGEGGGFKCRRAPSSISFLQLVGLVPGMGRLAPFRQD